MMKQTTVLAHIINTIIIVILSIRLSVTAFVMIEFDHIRILYLMDVNDKIHTITIKTEPLLSWQIHALYLPEKKILSKYMNYRIQFSSNLNSRHTRTYLMS